MDEQSSSTGREPAPDESLPDLARRLAEACRERDAAIARFEQSRAHEAWLSNELRHRVNNMLATIRSILRRTREADPPSDDFVDHVEGRLDAIARYQAGLIRGGRRSVELEDIIRDELLPLRCLDTPTCTITGPSAHIHDDAIEPIALAIHELATNSFTFGALARDGGRLDISWRVVDGPEGPALRFEWREGGVPILAAAPPRRGFGRQYIEEALPYQFGAVTSFEFRPGGIVCAIVLPLGDIVSVEPGTAEAEAGPDR